MFRRRALSPVAFERIALFALVAVLFIIVTGAGVRLTGSGLGCPQWPTCAADHVVAPDRFHPMVEFINRVVTAAVSVAVMAVTVAAYFRSPPRRDLRLLSWGLVLGLIAQIILGGETVKHRLNPGFVMSHFLLSMLILADAVVLHHRAGRPSGGWAGVSAPRGLVRAGRLIVVAALVTVVAGTVVTGAGPHSGANSADGRVRRWHLSLHWVTRVHGSFAMILAALAIGLAWTLHRRGFDAAVQARARQLLEALGLQISIGYTQYFSGVPVGLVAVHILGATLVWVTAIRVALALTGDRGGLGRPVDASVAVTV